MYNTPNYVKRYFMYNDKIKSIVSFPTKEELIKYIAKKTKKFWYKNTKRLLEDLYENKNLTAKDITNSHEFYCIHNNENPLDCQYIHKITTTLKPYIFYYLGIDNKYHIFDIAIWSKEIEDEVNITPIWSRGKNWCKRRKYHPYQSRSSYIYSRKSNSDYIENEYIPYLTHKARFYDFNYKYHKFDSRSERCWKKQTKKRHQYGNDSRNKYLESDFFIDIDDIDDVAV